MKKNDTAASMEKRILATLRRWGRGCVFSNRDFYHLGSEGNIAWCFYQLKNKGVIRALWKGIYDYPKFSTLLQETLAPDLDKVAQALARKHQWSIQPSGNVALNYLGLSTQVPTRCLYLSDGPSRSFEIEGRTLEFKHIPVREARLGNNECSMFIQAVKELGERALSDEYSAALSSLLTPALCNQLHKALPQLSEKLRRILRPLLPTPHYG
ncbi:MAG: hypothetical protein E7032_08180 [Akkermansiaceae bacterium]|nr:hypothetical protein [Akkermansiaceae bacterium]